MADESDESLKSKYDAKTGFLLDRYSGNRLIKPALKGSHFAPIHARIETLTRHLDTTAAKSSLDGVYVEPSRPIPIRYDNVDVLVVGSGPAGLSACISAKRTNPKLNVMIVEKMGCFGGCITTVGMETLRWYMYEGSSDVTGLAIEFENLAKKMGGSKKFAFNESLCLDASYFQIVADSLILENKIVPLLHTYVVSVIKSDAQIISGVIAESKSGRFVINAKRVIDCTGDADIAYFCNVPYRQLEREQMLGITKVFNASNVNVKQFLQYVKENQATYKDWSRVWTQETSGKENALPSPYLDKEFEVAEKSGEIPKLSNESSIGGTWSALHEESGEATNLNLVHFHLLDGTNVEDLTKAEMAGRKHSLFALQAMKRVPGWEQAKVRNFSMTIGIRDTRKIKGRYELTEDDVKNQCRMPEQSVGIFPEFIDGYNILILPTTGRYFHVPFGILVPDEGVENLLVAGRCVAGDKVSHAAMRNMAACCVTGQGMVDEGIVMSEGGEVD